MHWQMLQIKHFTALQKMPHFQDLQTGHGGTKYSVPPPPPPPSATRNIIVSQRKPILVIVSIKPFTCQSFGQNYFSREIEWSAFTETAFLTFATLNPLEPKNLLKILMILNMVIAIN